MGAQHLSYALPRPGQARGSVGRFGLAQDLSRDFPPFLTLSVTPVTRAFNLLTSFEIENGQKDLLGFNFYAQYALG